MDAFDDDNLSLGFGHVINTVNKVFSKSDQYL